MSGERKPDLLMIPGWSTPASLFSSIADQLAADFTVHCKDLPGQGEQGQQPWVAPEMLAEQWLAEFPDAHWLGWSLGGQIAFHAALAAQDDIKAAPRSLVLVGTNPAFVVKQHWPEAMNAKVFEAFAGLCQNQPDQARQQFLGLLAKGRFTRQTMIAMRQYLTERSWPDVSAQTAGLESLRTTDLRAALGRVVTPTLWLVGECDALVPAAAAGRAASLMPNAQSITMQGCGHAPFIDQQTEFLRLLRSFYQHIPLTLTDNREQQAL